MQSSSQIFITNKPTPNFLEARWPSHHAFNSVKASTEGNRYVYVFSWFIGLWHFKWELCKLLVEIKW